MFPSTSSSTLLPPQDFLDKIHYPRRLLLLQTLPPIASPPMQNDQLYPSSHDGSHDNNNNLIMIIMVFLCALICSLCVNFLIRCLFKCTSVIISEPNYTISMNNSQDQVVENKGVDKRALRTFPIVKYTSKEENVIKGLGTECVICLAEFKEGEKIRVLPKCNHGFHVKCIDKWLSSHSSCPTCRQSLVDTCQKIIGCDRPQVSATSASSVAITGEQITITIVPLEREDLIRELRG